MLLDLYVKKISLGKLASCYVMRSGANCCYVQTVNRAYVQ